MTRICQVVERFSKQGQGKNMWMGGEAQLFQQRTQRLHQDLLILDERRVLPSPLPREYIDET